MKHQEIHRTHRIGWLRGAVLGVNDGIVSTASLSARPVQAAFASAGTFAVGAALLLMLILFVPRAALVWTVSVSALVFLALPGALAARAGGSAVWIPVIHVTFWGALAMGLIAGMGALFRAQL